MSFDRYEDDTRDDFPDKGEVRCSHCRERYLYWEYRKGRHILVDDDGLEHQCSPASVDEFDVVK